MEFKTTFEELMEQTGVGHSADARLDTAYRLLSNGSWSAADAIFDEILREDAQNERALTGKRMINRELHVMERLSHYSERLERVQPEEAKAGKKRFALLRSKKTQAALIAAFVLFCSAFGALLLTSPADEPQAVISEKPSFFEQYGWHD